MGWINDGQLCTEEIHRFVTEDVFVIQDRIRDVYRYFEEIIQGIKQYTKQNQVQIISIGVDAFGSDFGLIDKDGNLLLLPKSYRGLTFDDDIFQLADGCMEPWEIYQYNGNQCMLSDTLHQLVRLKEKGDCRLRDGCQILFVADIFIIFCVATEELNIHCPVTVGYGIRKQMDGRMPYSRHLTYH